MTSTVRVIFDGKVLVPEGPVDLPVGESFDATLRPSLSPDDRPLLRLLDAVADLPADNSVPADGAAEQQHGIRQALTYDRHFERG